MLSFESLPQARVVRSHGKLVAPPPRQKTPTGPSAIGRFMRESAEIVVGMWPITAVMLFTVGLLVALGRATSY